MSAPPRPPVDEDPGFIADWRAARMEHMHPPPRDDGLMTDVLIVGGAGLVGIVIGFTAGLLVGLVF